MSAITQQIQSLLSPPDASTSQARTLEFINATFPSWDALNEPDVLDRHVETAVASSSELGRKVSSGVCNAGSDVDGRVQLEASSATLSKTISTALSKATTSLRSAKELSLTRHSLADQLASLTEELIPTGKGKQRTLLEELEDLHIKLSELKSTRTYVAVIEKALGLRCAHHDPSFVIERADEPPRSEDAVAQVRSTSNVAVSQSNLSKYVELQAFVTSVEGAVAPASSADPLNLVEFLKELRGRTWKDITNALSE